MKEPKDMTREELSAYLMGVAVALRYEGKSAYVAEQIEEAAARLRNSIDRPKVEVVEIDSGWYICINGQTPDEDDPQNYYEAQELLSRFKAALGMEGGEG